MPNGVERLGQRLGLDMVNTKQPSRLWVTVIERQFAFSRISHLLSSRFLASLLQYR
jgi:hypothetical protein